VGTRWSRRSADPKVAKTWRHELLSSVLSDLAKRWVVDLVIPARDCADTLGPVLEAIPPRTVRSVIVVDNGSTDLTAQIALDAGAVVRREPYGGYGAACRRAIAHLEALPTPPDVVVFMAGDGTDDPADIPKLVAPIHNDNAELVIGVRERARGLRSRVALGLIGALYRHRYEDLGPFRAIQFPALIALGLSDRGPGFHVEMQVKAIRYGLRIAEVPVLDTGRARRREGRVRELVGSAGATGRMFFQILRHAAAR
jgi:glycosyltransferase involved in cell wall biosynthesis